MRQSAAVLGSPIDHSLSPVLHRAAYDELGLTEWTYEAVECGEADLLTTLRRLEAAKLAGVSLTMPLKRAVLPMLSRIDRVAADTGAANTVLFGGVEGEWWGTNTDVAGMTTALREAGAGVASSDAAPWVLGAGATAASAVAALADLGARDVVVAARRPAAAVALNEVAARFGVGLDVRAWEAFAAAAAEVPLVVSTTPAGSTDLLAESLGGVAGVLLDVVYAPWPTPLASAWQVRGGRVIGGLHLLVHQAVEQVRLMTGHTPDPATMMAAGEAVLAVRSDEAIG